MMSETQGNGCFVDEAICIEGKRSELDGRGRAEYDPHAPSLPWMVFYDHTIKASPERAFRDQGGRHIPGSKRVVKMQLQKTCDLLCEPLTNCDQ
jgi:hypothetical protein